MAPRFYVEPLSGGHDRSKFISGSEPLDRYLRYQASQDVRRHIATCFVAVDLESQETAGYYTLSATSIPLEGLSPDVVRKLPRYPIVPAALLGRLAVATSHQGEGLGPALLADAIMRIARAELGIFAIVVDAKDAEATRFYERHGLRLLADEAHRLCLPMATALRALEGSR